MKLVAPSAQAGFQADRSAFTAFFTDRNVRHLPLSNGFRFLDGFWLIFHVERWVPAVCSFVVGLF